MAGNSNQLVQPAGADIAAEVTIPTSTAKGTSTAITFTPDPTQTSITESYLQPPVSEGYIVYSVYATATQTPDGYIRSKINGVDQSTYFGPINQTIPTNYHVPQFKHKLITLGPLDKLTMFYVNSAAVGGTTAGSVSLIVSYIRVPAGWKKPVEIPSN